MDGPHRHDAIVDNLARISPPRQPILDGIVPLAQYAAVSLRTGSGFLEALRDGRDIWLEGERVKDVTAHPRLRGTALTVAELYDLQHRPELRDTLSFAFDGSGERIWAFLHRAREWDARSGVAG